MIQKYNILVFLGLAVPTLLAFRAFFTPSPLVWGDAPYFYPEGLKELVAKPYLWTDNGNNFGGINSLLWLSPLMFVYGILHKLFGLDNDLIIRILFYFPATLLSLITPIFFARYLGYSRVVQFFTSLVYTLNTYFLLLVDGGQVGVALAYGFFPLTLLFLRKLIDTPRFKNFLCSLFFLIVLSVIDSRIAAIGILALVVWVFIDWIENRQGNTVKNLKFLILLIFLTIAVNSYWIIPSLIVGNLSVSVSSLQLISLLNPLLLFQPHWPGNEFGKVFPPPFYFVGIPLLVFGSLFARQRKVLVLVTCYLLFAFLVKGETPPFGEWYEWVVRNVPFAVAFRDSTKFFAPLLLFGGVLIGINVERIGGLLKSFLAPFAVYAYLLFLIHPALLGGLNGVLSGRELPHDFKVIYENLRENSSFFRTAWFPERHPFGFHTEGKQALDAKRLLEERPFASLNVGTYDAFNFVHDSSFLEWFDLLGIKYLVFSGDPRTFQLNEMQQQDWNNLLTLTASTSGLLKEDWGVSFPVYSLVDTKPHIFSVDKLIAVIGSEDIYQKLKEKDKNFSVGNQAFVFLEDGKFDPRNLQGIASQSAILVFTEKDEIDLTMSFLQKHFVSPREATKGVKGPSQWALRSADEYLKWKYEFLINGVDTKEFDYGKGIAFSSVADEWIYFDIDVLSDGEYVFATRTLTRDKDEQLGIDLFYGSPITYNTKYHFEWYIREGFSLKKGQKRVAFKNINGFHALNTVAFVPKKDWEEAQKLTQNFLRDFPVVRIDGKGDEQELQQLANVSQWRQVDYEMINPTHYKVAPPQNNWIVFTDSFNPRWRLKTGKEVLSSYPLYSMINGFYIDPNWQDIEITFVGQEYVRWGGYISLAAIFSLAVIFLWFYSKDRGKYV